MDNPMILEHVDEEVIPEELDPEEYGFYVAANEVDSAEAVGTALFAVRETPRRRELNLELFERVRDADVGECVELTNTELAEALGWDPSSVTRITQALDGITLLRIDTFAGNGSRIYPLAPVLKNYASRVLNLRPVHVTETTLRMMDFIATDYQLDGSLYDNGLTLVLVDRLYEQLEDLENLRADVRDGGRGYYELVVDAVEGLAETDWADIEAQCETFGAFLGELVLRDTEQSLRTTDRLDVDACECVGECRHYAVYLLQ